MAKPWRRLRAKIDDACRFPNPTPLHMSNQQTPCFGKTRRLDVARPHAAHRIRRISEVSSDFYLF
jgi:hypothetical protein